MACGLAWPWWKVRCCFVLLRQGKCACVNACFPFPNDTEPRKRTLRRSSAKPHFVPRRICAALVESAIACVCMCHRGAGSILASGVTCGPQESPTRAPHKTVPQECPTRVSPKSDPKHVQGEFRLPRASHKPDTRLSYTSVPKGCPTRVSTTLPCKML